ncbi:MAG: hypothetical protein ACT4QD_07935 [Acidobacteriota bacterium]
MFFKFRRMRAMDPLQVAMTGVRMGERYLQCFCHDASLTGGLATKTGLSGQASMIVPDEAQARRARGAAEKAGVLIEIKVGTLADTTWPTATFDMVVIDSTGPGFADLVGDTRRTMLLAAREVLRNGGRIEVIERAGGGRWSSRSHASASYIDAGGAEGALTAAGFKPVRTLAEQGGFRFVEGLKG